jgi:dGTPase
MEGFQPPGPNNCRQAARTAHAGSFHRIDSKPLARVQREELEQQTLAAGATLAHGAGNRAAQEAPDEFRTCFEKDRDRILHASAFRRLAGKTQVFIQPEDHQRTRLTHALEVAQVAVAIASAVGCNVALTEAIALGHDCGHGPGGHASEDAFSPYLDGGYDHAPFGADVVLAPLNLCAETLDGIRNHSWSRPVPSTPEGEIVSWADRIAYVCHDMEDAVHVGIVSESMLPELVREVCGTSRSDQLGSFISAVIDTACSTGTIGMFDQHADALAAFRAFNYDHIYMRPASINQSRTVIRVLSALVEYLADRPNAMGSSRLGRDMADHTAIGAGAVEPGSPEAFEKAVTWVGGMTDAYAFAQAKALLGWDPALLPKTC